MPTPALINVTEGIDTEFQQQVCLESINRTIDRLKHELNLDPQDLQVYFGASGWSVHDRTFNHWNGVVAKKTGAQASSWSAWSHRIKDRDGGLIVVATVVPMARMETSSNVEECGERLIRNAIFQFNQGRSADTGIKIHPVLADPSSDGVRPSLLASRTISVGGESFDIQSWGDAEKAFGACFKGTRALHQDGVSSVAESKHVNKQESGATNKAHQQLFKAQKNIAAQVMASNEWTDRCTYTDCVYIHFMTSRAKAEECAQSMH